MVRALDRRDVTTGLTMDTTPTAKTAAVAVGVGGLLFFHRGPDVLWAVMLGIGQGGVISLALMMMVLRASSSGQANALSGRAQGGGYLVPRPAQSSMGAVYGLSGGSTGAPRALVGAARPQDWSQGAHAGHGRVGEPSAVSH